MLTTTYDPKTGIVTTIAKGLSTAAEFDAYLPALGRYMRMSAEKHGKWLHIVDATENPVQTKDTQAHIISEWNEKPQEGGYVAYIVTSVLAKLQIDRMSKYPNKAFFTDEPAAKQWLLGRVDPTSALQVE
jgi:hypothetical protein